MGSDVWIYTGACVVGPAHVGDGARIGAGAFVDSDVAPRTTARPGQGR
ncbi:hypothetical protein [Demequina sediminis]